MYPLTELGKKCVHESQEGELGTEIWKKLETAAVVVVTANFALVLKCFFLHSLLFFFVSISFGSLPKESEICQVNLN